ncbi:transposase [Nonomuraea diastatica]|uniref:Transposase n=1 Tax=Nonomuraea diastatica TaxID=1848329 RepID=A0A4R4W9R6_9ACTN|nr:transposase [Nonomuraea diastatica]TDD13807.1 transposase [Nonomuraea diastatica]
MKDFAVTSGVHASRGDFRHKTSTRLGGTRHDRDVNAAKNVLAAGRSVSPCGGDVGPGNRVQSPVKQEPQPAKVGIPRL